MEGAPPPPPKSRRTLLWASTAYFGEGLPWSFLHQLATEFLTQIRASNTQIASTSLLHLAVTFKFAWSPFVDLFGRLRSWVIAMEIVLGLGMVVVGFVASPAALPQFWIWLAVLAVFHATHTGPGGPVPPSGKSLKTDYVYVMQFKDDKISHMTKIWNDGLALKQVGWA